MEPGIGISLVWHSCPPDLPLTSPSSNPTPCQPWTGPQDQEVGYTDTLCLQLDERKVVSGDGQAVRVWSHSTGRRIATLKGHTGRVTGVAFDEDRVVSGCSQGGVRIWAMDDLKCARSVRMAHDGSVTGGWTDWIKGLQCVDGERLNLDGILDG